MKNFKLLAVVMLFFAASMQLHAKQRANSKRCHYVRGYGYEKCLSRTKNRKRLYSNRQCRRKFPRKRVCDRVIKKRDLRAKVESTEEKGIFQCLKSVATNKKTMGIIPVGKESDEKFEIKNNSLTADQDKSEHLLVDAKTKQVQKCKLDGESKVCSRASWSDLKKIMKDNISKSRANPFESIDKKFIVKEEELNEDKNDLKSKEDFVQGIADGEAIKKQLDVLEASNPEEAKHQKDRWKKIFSEKLGVKDADFSNVEKLKAVKGPKIKEALEELKKEKEKEIADLPEDKKNDKKLYKDKITNVSDTSNDGKSLCHPDLGLKGLVRVVKAQSSRNNATSDESDNSNSANK